jgi:type I restriction enzyme S subunit
MMMPTIKKAPDIRFKGFEEEWEENKLGKIGETTIGEFVIKTRQNPNGLYPVYNGGKTYTGFYNEYNNEGNKIVISARGANAGFVNIVENRYWAGNSCYSIEIDRKKKFDVYFIYFLIKRNQNIFTGSQQAANIPSISKSDVEKFIINHPDYFEQTQIGSYFKELDSIIRLQEQKLEKITNLKKAMLEKMFAKEGADVAEIRFKGFTEKWKKKKLGEVVNDLYNGQTPYRMTESFWKGNINWLIN